MTAWPPSADSGSASPNVEPPRPEIPLPTRDCIDDQIARFYALGYPGTPSSKLVDLTSETWAEVLGDMSDREFVSACRRYRTSGEDRDRFFPIPARIRALSPVGALERRLGSEAEAMEAWGYMDHRLRYLSSLGGPSRDERLRTLDMDDPFNDEALWAALDAIGLERWRQGADDWTRKEWRTVYMDRRRMQAESPSAVRKMLAAPQIRGLLGVDS